MDLVVKPINLFNLVVVTIGHWAVSGEPAQLWGIEKGGNSYCVGGGRVSLDTDVQNCLSEVLVSVQDVFPGIPMEQVSISSNYDHIQWLGVVAEHIVQPEGMVELWQGSVSNSDIVNMLGIAHILVPHVAGCGEKLVKGGVGHSNLDPVICITSVPYLARWTGVGTGSSLHT